MRVRRADGEWDVIGKHLPTFESMLSVMADPLRTRMAEPFESSSERPTLPVPGVFRRKVAAWKRSGSSPTSGRSAPCRMRAIGQGTPNRAPRAHSWHGRETDCDDLLKSVSRLAATVGMYDFQRVFAAGSTAVASGNLLAAVEVQHYDGPFVTPDDARKENFVLRRIAHEDNRAGRREPRYRHPKRRHHYADCRPILTMHEHCPVVRSGSRGGRTTGGPDQSEQLRGVGLATRADPAVVPPNRRSLRQELSGIGICVQDASVACDNHGPQVEVQEEASRAATDERDLHV